MVVASPLRHWPLSVTESVLLPPKLRGASSWPNPNKSRFNVDYRMFRPDVEAGGTHIDFCAFEFPGCDGCPSVSGSVTAFGTIDDPMRSKVLLDWLNGDLHAPI
jgi:hypothetical protein